MTAPADLFHTGIIVDDVDATTAQLTERFGYRWCSPFRGEVAVRLPSGDTTVPIHFAYSIDAPRLEIVRAIPGTVWTPASSGIHHLGMWCDDVPGSMEAMEAEGYEFEAAGLMPDGTVYWAYLRPAAGPRIELVSTALRPGLEAYFESGHF